MYYFTIYVLCITIYVLCFIYIYIYFLFHHILHSNGLAQPVPMFSRRDEEVCWGKIGFEAKISLCFFMASQFACWHIRDWEVLHERNLFELGKQSYLIIGWVLHCALNYLHSSLQTPQSSFMTEELQECLKIKVSQNQKMSKAGISGKTW